MTRLSLLRAMLDERERWSSASYGAARVWLARARDAKRNRDECMRAVRTNREIGRAHRDKAAALRWAIGVLEGDLVANGVRDMEWATP